jgi:hypothetical protein
MTVNDEFGMMCKEGGCGLFLGEGTEEKCKLHHS